MASARAHADVALISERSAGIGVSESPETVLPPVGALAQVRVRGRTDLDASLRAL